MPLSDIAFVIASMKGPERTVASADVPPPITYTIIPQTHKRYAIELGSLRAKVLAQEPVTPASAVELTRSAMYAIEAYDAMTSADCFASHAPTNVRCVEGNPVMRPFSHGGFITMAAGFALYDIARDLALRHVKANAAVRTAVYGKQIADNLVGIIQTAQAQRTVNAEANASMLQSAIRSR